jgi:pimeloyl-ACP methyl ester carboxylesterase
VLVNPAAFGVVRIIGPARALARRGVDRILPRLLSRWIVARTHRMVYGDPSRISARDVDEYWAPSQFPAYSRAMRQLVRQFAWRRLPVEEMAARLRRLASPALVVLGTRDRLVYGAAPYVSALVKAGAPLQVRSIEGGGHAVNEERPGEVVALALGHLGSGPARQIGSSAPAGHHRDR